MFPLVPRHLGVQSGASEIIFESMLRDDAILLEIPTTGYDGFRICTEEDLKAHDLPIQGRISQDHAKTPIMARLCSL